MALLPSLGPPGRPEGQDDLDPRLKSIVEDLQQQRAATQAVTVLHSDPETVRRANALSRKSGVPAPIVEGDLKTFEARDRLDKMRHLTGEDESIARWASDPRNAASAADDTESLGVLGSVWRQVKNVGSSLKAGLYSSTAGLDEIVAGLAGGLADAATPTGNTASLIDALGLGGVNRAVSAPVTKGLRGIQRTYEGAAKDMAATGDAARPDGNFVERSLYAGFESIPTTIGGVVVGLATRNPEAGAAVMAGTVGGGEYRKALDAGLSPGRAARYAVGQGTVEYLTEKIPASRLLGDLASKSPVVKTLMRQLTAEIPGEQVATFIQDMNEWANLHPEKPVMDFLRERIPAAAQTLLATISGVGGTVATTTVVEKTTGAAVKVADRISKATAAKREGRTLDDLAEAAGKSKLKERDPQAFAELMRTMGGDAGVSHVYIDGEAARAFMQTDRYDGSLDAWGPDIFDAAERGGDFAIPIEDALTDLSGTPAWEALRPDMRLSPGGMSPREGEAFDPGEAMQNFADGIEPTSNDPKVKLFENIADTLMNAGFTPTTARVQAELLASRYATRAERMGQTLTGNEFDPIEVQQVLPPALSAIRNASEVEPDAGLKAVIDEMQRGRGARSDTARLGPSLIDWIRKQGGVEDRGGDIAHMGAVGIKGVAKKGHTKLIKPHVEAGMFGAGNYDNSPDTLALRAWEAGFFPDMQERPTVNEFLDAIGEGLAGTHRYSTENDNSDEADQVREAAEELRALLSNMDMDPDEATPAEIKAAVDRYVAERAGPGFDQPAFHGSPHIFDRFSLEHIGTGEGAQAYGWGLYFAGKKEIAEYYRTALTSGNRKLSVRVGDNATFEIGPLHVTDSEKIEQLRALAKQLPGNPPWFGLRRVLDIIRTNVVNGFHSADDMLARLDKEPPPGDARDQAAYRAAIDALMSNDVTMEEAGTGRLYEVEIPEDDEYLLWDKPLSEQPEKVKEALAKVGYKESPRMPSPPEDKVIASIIADALKFARVDSADIELTINNDSMLYNKGLLHAERAGVDTDDLDVGEYVVNQAKHYVHALMRRELTNGEAIYRNLSADLAASPTERGDKAASLALHEAGIAGIKYLDGGSRSAGDGSFNYVVFDENRVQIRSYNQSDSNLFDDPAQPERSMTSEQRAELEARQKQSMARRGGQQALSDQEGGLFSAERDQRSLFQNGQTETPEFKRWFGDSKVVDADGKPLVVYHGTPEAFDEFDAEASLGLYYFADSWEVARNYGSRVVPAYLSIQNPMRVPSAADPSHIPALAEEAKATGHDGLFIDSISDVGGEQRQIIAFEPTQIKSATGNRGTFDPNDPSILNQSFADGPRGRIVFPEGQFTGNARIELFKARNLSTFLHEAGHLFLEELKFDAEQSTGTDGNEAARQTFADFETVKAWFKSNGHPIGGDGAIPTEAHELWARGFERFLMEGKAPSQSLRRAFESFKSWLVNIYRSALRLDAPITDDIRGVMGRLIATDAEIAEAAEQQEIQLIFSSAVEAGMGESAFRALQEAARDARQGAHDELLKRVMAPIRARVTAEYKEREAPVRAEVTEGVDKRPVFRAMRQLRDTPMSSEWLAERGVEGLPPQVPPVSKKGGANPADIAEQAGFNSAEEMIDALRGLEIERQKLRANDDKRSPRQAIIDGLVEETMNARYGDPFTDGSIEEEALALIHNDAAGEVMAAELRALGRQTGKRATTYRLARNWAREQVRTGSVNETTSRSAIQRYERSAAKAGKAAMDAMIAGDRDEAFRHKQSQMVNNALVAEAKAALDEVEAAVARMEKLAKRRTIKSVDQDYLEQAQALLEAVEFRHRSQASLKRQGKFEEWARAQEADGHDIAVPASFEASLGTTHWSKLTVEKLLGLDAATQQIMYLGRKKQEYLDNQEKREREELIGEAEAGLAGTPKKPVAELMEPGWWDGVKSFVLSFDASLLKMEQMLDWLDNGNESGVFNRIVFRPIADAQTREKDMLVEYGDRLRAAFEKVGKKGLSRWNEPFSDPALINRETGEPWRNMKRQHLIAMALNMGNEGNIQRLTDGYGWSEGTVRDILNRELTAEDWQFVQEVWDTVDSLWPEIAALERRVNGIAPDKVEAAPVETPFGVLRGGYYPAIYDTAKDYEAERHAEQSNDLFESKYTRATTRASSTKDRSEKVSRPISLQLGVINRHVQEVVHDITHREAVMQANRFLNEPRIKRLVDETLGREYRKQFQPWLKYVANQWAIDRAGNEGFMKFANNLRANTTVVGMGFRFTTVIQQFAGLSNSVEKVGGKWMAQALASSAAHPMETYQFVRDRSGEFRHRMDTIERDINQTIKTLSGKSGALTAAKRFAFHGIGYTDRIVSVPTWMAGYNKAIEGGASEADAIAAGDKALRLSQGAAGSKDLPAIARGTGNAGMLLKYLTMFYTYVSTVYSRQRNLGRDVRRASAKDVPALMARAWWLIVVPPLMAELLAGRAPDDDEDWGLWAFEAITLQALGSIPIVRDAARPILQTVKGEQPFDYAMSPVQRAIQTVVNASGDAITVLEGEETTKATRNALEAIGYTTGLVPGQLAQSAQFLVDVAYGEQDPETLSEWWEGIRTGKIKDA